MGTFMFHVYPTNLFLENHIKATAEDGIVLSMDLKSY